MKKFVELQVLTLCLMFGYVIWICILASWLGMLIYRFIYPYNAKDSLLINIDCSLPCYTDILNSLPLLRTKYSNILSKWLHNSYRVTLFNIL